MSGNIGYGRYDQQWVVPMTPDQRRRTDIDKRVVLKGIEHVVVDLLRLTKAGDNARVQVTFRKSSPGLEPPHFPHSRADARSASEGSLSLSCDRFQCSATSSSMLVWNSFLQISPGSCLGSFASSALTLLSFRQKSVNSWMYHDDENHRDFGQSLQ